MLPVLLLATPLADPVVTSTRTPLAGGFAIEHQRWVNTGAPSIHGRDQRDELRLVWTSRDGRLRVSTIDNGFSLTLAAAVGEPGQAAVPGCEGSIAPQVYGPATATAAGWRRNWRAAASLLVRCPAADAATLRRYRVQYQAAAAALPAAGRRLRAEAATIFGSTRRCLAAETQYMPQPEQVCVRYAPAG